MSTRLEALLASGELQRAAAGCPSESELARRLGMSPSAYKCGKQRIVAQGRYWPAFEELRNPTLGVDMARGTERIRAKQEEWRGQSTSRYEHRPADTFEDEPTEERTTSPLLTQTGLVDGPNLAAFDAEPDPPLPAIGKGFRVSKVSTLVDGVTGETKQQWIKTSRDASNLDALLEAMAGLAESWRGKSEPIEVPTVSDADILAVYPIGDGHLGQQSWGTEVGEDFDLKIAERNQYAAVDRLVAVAPAAKQALVIGLGDMFHSDSSNNTTTKGTRVDVDGRWPKVFAVGVRLMRRIIDRCLEKHEKVTVIIERGNHDSDTAVALCVCLAQFYEREPRVTVDTSPAKFHWYRFGACLVGTTHSDTVKLDALGPIMACDRKADWGETTYRYWYCGHVHHSQVKEYPGVIVETFRTLAAHDSWHHGQGYRAGRDMRVIVLHREYGEINRHVVGIQQIAEGAAAHG